MSIIINIDTATESASVSIAENGRIISQLTNEIQKEHAAFLHPAIISLLSDNKLQMSCIDAIAVTVGPGSYTGIRVGLASAKGLSIALDKPFITVNSLELLAKDAILNSKEADPKTLFCPMIDARRMEVYTAIYNDSLEEVLMPCAMIINENSFSSFYDNYHLIHLGSGADKLNRVVKLRNCTFIKSNNTPAAMALMTYDKLLIRSYTDVVYSDPLYLKEFFNSP